MNLDIDVFEIIYMWAPHLPCGTRSRASDSSGHMLLIYFTQVTQQLVQ